MKLTGPACTEAMSGAEEAGRRERTEDNAGGVRVELRVRPIFMNGPLGIGAILDDLGPDRRSHQRKPGRGLGALR